MPVRPGHRRFRTLLAATLLGSLGLGLTPVGSGATVPPGARPASAAAGQTGADGRWQVVRTGSETYEVSWRAPRRLPTTSDRATIVSADGVPLGVPTLRSDAVSYTHLTLPTIYSV